VNDATTNDVDVLILGAGMAGLTAARALAERNLRVLVLEARDRVGGRILSHRTSSGDIVELGAEFVHGRAPELFALLAEAGVTAVERDGAMLREDFGGGLAAEDDTEDDMFAPLEQLEDVTGPDKSFADWLRTSDVPEDARSAINGYVEGFNAADATTISAQSIGVQQRAEDAIEGDRSWHVHGGYAQLPAYLAERVRELGGRIQLSSPAETIRWHPGHVEIHTAGQTFTAPRAIVTLPLGVLQRVNTAGNLRVDPEPAAIPHARRMEMGHVLRLTLVFRSCWWQASPAADPDALQRLSFLFTPQRTPAVWWTTRTEREPAPTLTGWIGGPRSRELAGKPVDDLAAIACRELSGAFAVDQALVRGELLSAHTHAWDTDQFSRGAYSYVAAGALDAPHAMTLPEAKTLFFAGEHTDVTGHWGTVHAAIRSGLRAAAQMLGEPT
jgi:monoamine oxidase